jgi:hypothetical protein
MHAFAGRYIRRPPVYMYLGHTPHVSEIKDHRHADTSLRIGIPAPAQYYRK